MADQYDLVIVGMGSGGMVAAEFAARIGVRVAVVERGRVGGDCLWTGCVPSKALLASAKAAHTMRHADHYGIAPVEPTIDTAEVWSRIRRIQHEIAATDDDPERFAGLGVDIVRGNASLAGPHEVVVDGVRRLTTRFVLLCTGSRPAEPPIPGLADVGYLTSETVFELDRAPDSLVVIGGGPIAIEMAQGFARLGLATTVLQKGDRILPRDEPTLVEVLRRRLVEEGIDLRLGVSTERVASSDGMKVVHGREAGGAGSWKAAELLVAVGRTPNVEGLGLDEVGIGVGPRGIEADGRLRTAVPSIYVGGDVAGRTLFTHSAAYESVRAVRDMFFPGRGTADAMVPWCTFTDPELAHAGLTETEARERHGDDVEVWRHELAHSDRARAEGADDGAIVIVTAKERVVGAHVLAPAAGELIHELALAIQQRLKLSALAGLVHVYPTIATGVAQLGAESAYAKAAKLIWLRPLARL